MGELGEQSAALHAEIGAHAASLGVTVVAVGALAAPIAEGAASVEGADVRRFETHDDASKWLDEVIGPGDVVLVKGSRSERMEDVIDAMRSYLSTKN